MAGQLLAPPQVVGGKWSSEANTLALHNNGVCAVPVKRAHQQEAPTEVVAIALSLLVLLSHGHVTWTWRRRGHIDYNDGP